MIKRRLKSIAAGIVIIATMVFVIHGCGVFSHNGRIENSDEMMESLGLEIPIGLPATDAMARLQQRGFEASISDASTTQPSIRTVHGRWTSGGLVQKVWLVEVNCDAGIVRSLKVQRAFTGP